MCSCAEECAAQRTRRDRGAEESLLPRVTAGDATVLSGLAVNGDELPDALANCTGVHARPARRALRRVGVGTSRLLQQKIRIKYIIGIFFEQCSSTLILVCDENTAEAKRKRVGGHVFLQRKQQK